MHKFLFLSILIISVCILKAQPTNDNSVNAISITPCTRTNITIGKSAEIETISASTITLDLNHYAKGMYLLQYQNEGRVLSQKIIKQ